jgi:hypothetical protein
LTYVNAATQFWFDLATKSMRFARKCARRKRRFAPTLRLRNLQDVACALAHLDRGADPALRAFKNGSRHDVADRIFAPLKPQLFALRLEAEQQCAARCMLAAVPVFLFGVWGSSKPPSRSPAAVRNALFEAPTVRSG